MLTKRAKISASHAHVGNVACCYACPIGLDESRRKMLLYGCSPRLSCDSWRCHHTSGCVAMKLSANQTRREFLATSGVLAALSAMPEVAVSATNPLNELSAAEAVTAIRRGDLSAEDYARALLDRCSQLKDLNAFILLDRDAVLEAAQKLDQQRSRGKPLGVLAGLPIPLKDSIGTTSMPMTCGTRSLRSFRLKEDATIWQRLSQSGAILLGKNNLHEMSLGWTSANQVYGVVRNPHDPTRIPGGSSGGTAVAVSARMAPAGIGEDTNGSIRVPAAMCGITGLRPTHGRYPGAGVMPLAPSLDTLGPMARRVYDLCLLDSVVTGDPIVTSPMDLTGVRIGVSREYYFTNLDAGVQRVMDAVLSRLREAGAVVVEAEIPDLAALVGKVTVPIIYYEARRSITRFLAEHDAPVDFAGLVSQLSPEIRKQAEEWVIEGASNEISDQAYQDAIRKYRPALQETWRNYFSEHRLRAVISPVVRMPAPRLPQYLTSPGFDVEINGTAVPARVAFARNIAPSSSAGLPSIVLPAGMTSGLPVGIEFDGPAASDRDLLSLALAVERVVESNPAPTL
jgi:indoleacetamide hydrolase